MTSGAAKKIMLVDEEKDFLDIFGQVLEREGFAVEKVVSPEAALAAVADFKPDLILLDIALPGMDGITLLEEMRKKLDGSLPKVLFATNLDRLLPGAPINEDILKNFGAQGIIHKTDDLDEIVARIKQELD